MKTTTTTTTTKTTKPRVNKKKGKETIQNESLLKERQKYEKCKEINPPPSSSFKILLKWRHDTIYCAVPRQVFQAIKIDENCECH